MKRDWPAGPKPEEIAERKAQWRNPWGREVRLSLVDVTGRTVPPGEPVENADARALLTVRVEVSCDLGWHDIGSVPVPPFPSRQPVPPKGGEK